MPPFIEIIIDDGADRKFARLNHLFSNPVPVMQGPVRSLIQDAIRQQFHTEGEYGGTPWQGLDEGTQKGREREGYGGDGPIMRRSDRLFNALTRTGAPGGRLQVSRTQMLMRTVGIPYAKAQHAGSSHTNLPARPLIPDPMPPSFVRRLHSIISGYIIKATLE